MWEDPDRGFTLVELMVVISIMVILAASVGISAWGRLIRKQKLESEARLMAVKLRECRSYAMSRLVWCSVFFEGDNYKLCKGASPCSCDQELEDRSLDDAVSISGTTFSSDCVSFDPFGNVRNESGGLGMGTVSLSAGDFSARVVVTKEGTVRVEL